MLFHVSEDADIRVFIPRPAPLTTEPVVWAIDAAHLRNYLLPRNCPRVTYARGPRTSVADAERFVSEGRPVVAIEWNWLERAERTPLVCYSLPRDSFELHDATAGYFVARERVIPAHVEIIARPLERLRELGVELRVLPNLWALHEAVAASTLDFSMIRMHLAHSRA
jgi:hypothetical protein